jgi:stage V sporulation protein S
LEKSGSFVFYFFTFFVIYFTIILSIFSVLKISSKSNPNSVAGAIAGLVKESNKAEMQAIGAGALNQAVKAVAIARGFVAPAGVDLVCIPAFAEVEVEGEDRTGIKLIVESRK